MTRTFGPRNSSKQQEQARRIVIVCLVLLVLFSGVGALFLYSASPKEEGEKKKPEVRTIFLEPEPEVDLTPVLVPNVVLRPGSGLDPTMFRVESMPKEKVPPRSVRSYEEIQGLFVKDMVPANQPVLVDHLTRTQPNSAITANIPEGFRAVTILVDERTSVEGWARPGARVDVVWATEIRGEKAVSVIVQNAKVLSAQRQAIGAMAVGPDGQPIGPDGQPIGGVPNTVTLLVSVEDAAKIQLGSTTGSLSLSLRGDKDGGAGGSAPAITLTDLLAKSRPDAEKKKRKGIIRIRKPNGEYEEMVLEEGRLVPAEE
jgi:Flp pilus assembly protein CpaB